MKKLLLIALLGIATISSGFELDYQTKMDMLKCRKGNNLASGMADALTGAVVVFTMADSKDWTTAVSLFNSIDSLRKQMLIDCGVLTKQALIRAEKDLEHTMAVIGEFITLELTMGGM